MFLGRKWRCPTIFFTSVHHSLLQPAVRDTTIQCCTFQFLQPPLISFFCASLLFDRNKRRGKNRKKRTRVWGVKQSLYSTADQYWYCKTDQKTRVRSTVRKIDWLEASSAPIRAPESLTTFCHFFLPHAVLKYVFDGWNRASPCVVTGV